MGQTQVTPLPLITACLVGNPNCGKTTILNRLARGKESVGNYPRVTVQAKTLSFQAGGRRINLVDLPGIHALTAQTPEERESRDFIHDRHADVLINVLDAGNLERSLFLTTQLVEMGQPIIFVLNMIDEARARGLQIDQEAMTSMLGGPVVMTDAIRGEGLDQLVEALREFDGWRGRSQPRFLPYDAHLDQAICRIDSHLQALHPGEMTPDQSQWMAIKLLEGDDELARQEAEHDGLVEMLAQERQVLADDHGDECRMLFARARYGFAHGLVAEAVHGPVEAVGGADLTRRLDALFLHRFLGIPLFIVLLWLMFQATFTLGELPMNWIDAGVVAFSSWVDGWLPEGMTHDLVVDGILAGMGGTIIFLPNIVILFFFMALFSETGYLARAAFLMDRVMHAFGLHGKALIPLVMGFGCNVPAVMAARTIEDRRSRLITILINPFMLCAARLPVFILFAGAFFSEFAGAMVFLMYMLSILVGMGASIILNRFFLRQREEAFVMELPPYRLPTPRAILVHMGDKALNFLQKVAGVILVGSIVIWFAQEFPREIEYSQDYPGMIAAIQAEPTNEARRTRIRQLERQRDHEALANSYLGRVSRAIAPVFEPLTFTWKDTVAILTGFVAKEVVVASYAVLYAQGDQADAESPDLRQALGEAMTPLSAFAFMVFALLYSPCLGTIATIQREAGGWRWAGFSFLFSFSLAWTLALAVVTVGSLLP